MKLVSFSVQNYRSITTANKLPIKQITILIGPNNEGKSNILKALVTALETLKSFRELKMLRGRYRYLYDSKEQYDWLTDFPVSLQAPKPTGESIFNLEFELTAKETREFNDEIKSNLNGSLPIQLTLGKNDPGFKVLKRGPGGPALSRKAEEIAQFIAKRIEVVYIPAVRTAESAHNIVEKIVEKELEVVEKDEQYKKALSDIERIQSPVLEAISKGIENTLKEFLPRVKSVKVSISTEKRYRALRRSCDIVVNDGTPTMLERKGDGAQSLAALSLMRQKSSKESLDREQILAIEEPESHLHPLAMHQLKQVLGEIATKNQIIMTTHCQKFVDRINIKSNILVHENKAKPAKDLKQIRDILGVRAADNLQHAELILLVEGEEDKKALCALIKNRSSLLRSALEQGTLAIDSLLGASKLSYKVSLIRESLCEVFCFLDYDQAGKASFSKAESEGLIARADAVFAACNGLKESELEDLYADILYSSMIENKYGVTVSSSKFKGNKNWAHRLQQTFKSQGKLWDQRLEKDIKMAIAGLVEENPASALNSNKTGPIDALVRGLEGKLKLISEGKK